MNQLVGGAGLDTAAFEGAGQQVYANLSGLVGYVGGTVRALFNSIENLTGGNVADVPIGDTGANAITGGLGADQLFGQLGADTFVYRSAGESNLTAGYDGIGDFQTGVDHLDLTALNTTADRILITAAGPGAMALYADLNPATAGYEFTVAFTGANAIAIGDIIL